MDQHHPTIIIILTMYQHHPINGSKPSYRWSFIIIIFQWIDIILPMDHQHYDTNGVASSYLCCNTDHSLLSLSYQWIINIILPMNHQHNLINGSTSSYWWIFIIIILSRDQQYPINGASTSSSYQWSINIIIISMEHYHYPIM